MSKTRKVMLATAQAIGAHFAVLLFSTAAFGFFCIFFFHATFSVTGCSVVMGLAALLWVWACLRSDEPALRTFVTLMLHSSIVFLFFLGVLMIRLMLEHSSRITAAHVLVLLSIVALFWYLRSKAIRRNKNAQILSHERDLA